MAWMETLSQAIDRLVGDGYVENFRATDQGMLVGDHDTRFDPAEMSVDEVVRFEGTSNPDDQAILYALSTEGEHRGLYSTAYGPGISRADAAALNALP